MARFDTQFPEGSRLKGLAGLAEAAAAFRWRVIRTLGDAFGISQETMVKLASPAALLSGSSIVRKLRMLAATHTLSSVPEGKLLVDAAKGKIDMVLEPHMGKRVGYNMQPGNIYNGEVLRQARIGVATETTHGMLIQILSHELQHQRQRDAGVFNTPAGKMVSPTDQIWWMRFVEADAQATSVEAAWKLRMAGKPAAWVYATHCRGTLPLIAGAYLRQLRADPASENDGRAKRAAFDTWFATSAEGTVFYNTAAMDNLPSVETLRKARENGTPFGQVTPQDLRRIGELSEVNYLALPIGRTLNDAYYRQPDRTPEQTRRLAAVEAAYSAARDGTPVANVTTFNEAARPVSLYNPAAYAPKDPAPEQSNPAPKPAGGINLGYYSPGR